MANVKRRVNAPKSAPKNETNKKRVRRTKKDLKPMRTEIDSRDSVESSGTDAVVANKHVLDENLLFLTPDEKVKYFLQNDDQFKDNFASETCVQTRKTKERKNNNPTPMLNGLVKKKPGRPRNSNDSNLNTMDNVNPIQCDTPSKRRKINGSVFTRNGVNNNNDIAISDQNNKMTSKNDKALSHSKKANKSPLDVQPEANISSVSEQSENTNEQSVTVNLADKPKARAKGRPRKKPSLNGVVTALPLFQCDYCEKTFNRKHSLVRHIYLHLGRQPHACPFCPKKFRVLANVKIHVDRDHSVHNVDENTETFSCSICDKPFLTKENLQLHLTSHVKGENSFKCIYCGKKFAYQLLLIQHEKKHLVTGKYQCTLCDVKYNSRDKLYVHVKSHLKLADYICQYCGREYLRANSMKRHVQTMHAGHTIQCPICNKQLKGHLTEHIRTHEKKRPHTCQDCGKNFAQSSQLKVHRRGHTGFRPYMCRICEKPFSHSNALLLHFRRHTGEKPFPCAECPMQFSQIPHMKAHMLKIHGKINPYKCRKCNDYFKLNKDLVLHKISCTGTGVDTDNDEGGLQDEDAELAPVESTMTLSRMRLLLALLLTMVASKEKLKYLGFNKRLVDDLLVESLEAMGQIPCRDETVSALVRLRTNIEKLLDRTVPSEQMEKFRKENKSTEELLELLTSEKEK